MVDLGDVATVLLRPPLLVRCSIATVGGSPDHRIDIRFCRGLHELPCVRVERFEIAALPFGEKNVESYRAFPTAAHAGDDREAVSRNRNIDTFEIMLPRVREG